MLTEKILVVDDEQTVCNSIKKILSRKGYVVENSLNAEEAMIKMKNTSYDLVITDMKMPKISGLELLEIVKDYYPELEVVLITGYASVDTAIEAIKLGASDYLPKPFTPDELLEVAEKAIKKRKDKASLEQKTDEKEKTVYGSGFDFIIKDENIDFEVDKSSSDIVDVDLPFNESELIKYTSRAYVNSLTHSDIPISSLYQKSNMEVLPKEYFKEFRKETEELESVDFSEEKILSKEIVDVDKPYKFSDIEPITGLDYIYALDRSDIPRAALYARDFAAKHSILVIDEDPIVCRILNKVLAKESNNVESACDLQIALKRLKLFKYNLIFLNSNISKVNEMDVLKEIKTKYPDIPVVVISDRNMIHKAVDAMKSGAYHYITKPFTLNEFRKITKELLST